MRLLITGGAGFIGSNLVRRFLALDVDLHLLVRPQTDLWRLKGVQDRLNLHLADLCDSEATQRVIEASRPRAVVHLATRPGHPRTREQRIDALRVAVLGTVHLLEAARNIRLSHFIHFGSTLEYEQRDRPLRESDPLRPNTDRGIVKMVSSCLVTSYAQVHNIPAIILRPSSVYGPWEAPNRFIPTLLRAAMTGEPVRITRPGIRHDWVYVEDVVEACQRALQLPVRPGEAYNIGTGEQWSNEEVAAAVEVLTGKRLDKQMGAYPPGPTDRPCWVVDNAKAARQLGWSPSWDLKAGLAATLEWMRREHLSPPGHVS